MTWKGAGPDGWTFQTKLEQAAALIGWLVLVKNDDGWVAYFCTDPNATAADILSLVADREAIEQVFHDIKEIWGAGQQQLRNGHANVGAYHLNLWAHTLVELWAWHRAEEQLVDRGASPWDTEWRRPSHADRRKALTRAMLQAEIQAVSQGPGQNGQIESTGRTAVTAGCIAVRRSRKVRFKRKKVPTNL